MPKAIAYAGKTVVAESDDTVVVEGNHYFPISDVKMDLLTETDMHSVCHWKGEASYFTVKGESETFEDSAWTYKEPKTQQAEVVRDRIAFWHGIRVEEK